MNFTAQLRAHTHKIICTILTMAKSNIEFFCSIKDFIIYRSMDDSQNAFTTVTIEFLACSQVVKINPVARSPPTDSSSFGPTFPAFPPSVVKELESFCRGKIDKIVCRSSALASGAQKLSH